MSKRWAGSTCIEVEADVQVCFGSCAVVTVPAGGFGSMAEYLRHAVRQDLERADEAKLERLLLDGLESGEPVEMTDEWMEKRRQILIARVAKQRGKKRA